MCQFRSKVPGSELSICGRFCHKGCYGQEDEGQGEQEDGLVAEHHGDEDEVEEGQEEADRVEDPSEGQETVLGTGLERSDPERWRS